MKLSAVDKEGNKVCQNFRKIVEEIKDEGRMEGRVEGKVETLEFVVKQLKAVGAAYDMMMTVTGLSQAEIERIA